MSMQLTETPRGCLKPRYKTWPHTHAALAALRVLAVTDAERAHFDRIGATMLAEDRTEVAARRFVASFQHTNRI